MLRRRLAIALMAVGAVVIALVVSEWISDGVICSLGTDLDRCYREALVMQVLLGLPGALMILAGAYLLAQDARKVAWDQ